MPVRGPWFRCWCDFFKDFPGRRANLGSFCFRLFPLTKAAPKTSRILRPPYWCNSEESGQCKILAPAPLVEVCHDSVSLMLSISQQFDRPWWSNCQGRSKQFDRPWWGAKHGGSLPPRKCRRCHGRWGRGIQLSVGCRSMRRPWVRWWSGGEWTSPRSPCASRRRTAWSPETWKSSLL